MAEITIEGGPVPSLPPATDIKLFVDETDLHVKQIDSTGQIIDLSEGEVNTVDSVNGQTGVVVLDADDIDDSTTTNKFTNTADISKLAGRRRRLRAASWRSRCWCRHRCDWRC
jgi:hypothetical protein